MTCRGIAVAFVAALLSSAFSGADASAVTVRIANPDGVPIEDAIAMFDPMDSQTPAAPAATVAIVDQINRHFVPKTTVVQKGTSISFPNSDHIRHQVYSFSPAKTFTLKLYAGSPKMSVPFDKPGLVILGCNIHDSMVGFIAVAESPYFGKTAADGTVSIDVPPGRYRLRIWHPELAAPIGPRIVQVGTGSQAFPVQAVLDHAAAPSPWPE